jgi:MOSC domain-containing protein YiiM
MSHGRLIQIWVKRAKLGPMDPRAEVELVAQRGIVGNANQGGTRQVTLIEDQRWVEMQGELGASIDPVVRRANLLVSGVPLTGTRGRVLRVGACRLRVRGETRPCERMEEAHPGLRAAMSPDWRGGAYAEVLDDGVIRAGDTVSWE